MKLLIILITMKMENDGWIKLYRKLEDNKIWESKPSSWVIIWLHILLKVSFENNSNYKKGQAHFRSVKYEKLPFDISKHVWYNCLNWLEQEGMIKRQKVWRGEVITVVNYEKYQLGGNHRGKTTQDINKEVVGNNLEAKNDERGIIGESSGNHKPKELDEIKAEDGPKNVRIKELRIKNKDKEIVHENEKQKISLKDIKQEKAKELIIQFCSFRGIPLDKGFFAKNIRSARSLVGYYPVELILAGILWRLKNDPDNFWTSKLFNLNTVYSHFAEWIAQSKLKTERTFTDWLARNTEQDYRSIEEPDAKIKAFFMAFNRALKDGIYPTPEEWTKYQKARELNNESLRRR